MISDFTILAHHHHAAFEVGSPGALQNAAGASALLMIALIALLCIGILAFALNLRRRSLNPSPESLLLAEVNADREFHDSTGTGHDPPNNTNPHQAWERSDDWWKAPPPHS